MESVLGLMEASASFAFAPLVMAADALPKRGCM
jgi:hypothetical protein